MQKKAHPEDPGDCDNPVDDGYFARLVVTKKTIDNNHGNGPPVSSIEGREYTRQTRGVDFRQVNLADIDWLASVRDKGANTSLPTGKEII